MTKDFYCRYIHPKVQPNRSGLKTPPLAIFSQSCSQQFYLKSSDRFNNRKYLFDTKLCTEVASLV